MASDMHGQQLKIGDKVLITATIVGTLPQAGGPIQLSVDVPAGNESPTMSVGAGSVRHIDNAELLKLPTL